MKHKRTLLKKTLLFCALMSLSVNVLASDQYKKSYVGIYINENTGSSFYPVIMNEKETPYLAVRDTLQHWLQLNVGKRGSVINATIQATGKTISFNPLNQTLKTADGKVIALPNNAFVYKNKKYWLRYDYWPKWLPVTARWNLGAYEVFLTPSFEMMSQLKADRAEQITSEKLEKKQEETLAHLSELKPNDSIEMQGRYRITWDKLFESNQDFSANYDGNIDIFQGTLYANGQTTLVKGDESSSPPYWNYTLMDKPHFHELQFGDFDTTQTMLTPGLSLRNGVNFERLDNTMMANGFTYQGHTLPNTEVDVWSNGILLTILNANATGNFTFNDPNSLPGTRYTLRFYFKDGTERNQVIQLSQSNENLLEPPGTWNTVLQNGYLSNNVYSVGSNNVLTEGRMTHAALWYGLTKNLTLGAEGYRFPSETNRNAGGVDAIWQTLPDWDNVLQTIGYKASTDYAWQSNYTGFTNHNIQFELKHQAINSPINQIATPLPYTTQAFLSDVLPTATHFYTIKDIYSADSWQTVTSYQHTNAGSDAELNIQTSLSPHFSLGAVGGLVRPEFKYTQSYKQLQGRYYMDTNDIFQATRLVAGQNSTSSLTYLYQTINATGIDVNATLSKPDQAAWDWYAQVEWRFTPYTSISVNSQRHEFYFSFSVYGVASQGTGPVDYSNFATGTIAGYLRAPAQTPNGQPIPVANAKIDIGGLTTTTDKNGYYFLSGLPTYQRLKFDVEPSSLDASLIPDKTEQVVFFRPGTYIRLNPKIDISAGLDGNILHDGPIPKGTKVVVLDKPGGKIIRTAEVEPNGFFILDKLKENKYYLEIEGVKSAPKLVQVNLHNRQHWASNVDIKWQTVSHTSAIA